MKALGGTTRLWGGQLVAFDEGDLAARDDSGRRLWPIGYEEYARYVARAFELLGIDEEARDTAAIWHDATGIPPEFGPELTASLNIWLRQPDFTRLFARELATNPLLSVITDATLQSIAFDASGRAEAITVADPSGLETTLKPNRLVLAQGTIETVATLLRCAADPGCPFAKNANLGRYYLDHLHGLIGTAHCTDKDAMARMFDTIHRGRHKYSVKIRARRLPDAPNMVFTLNPPLGLGEIAHETVGLLRRAFTAPGTFLGSIPDGLKALRVLIPAGWRYMTQRRSAIPLDRDVALGVELEQLPLRESRLTLEPGVPPRSARIVLDWQVDGREVVRLRELAMAFADRFAEMGLGRVELAPDLLTQNPAILGGFHDSSHQMGGARMAECAERGVCDADARVFGTANLYLAGGAVFPTGSFANSTLTGIALGLRLTNHLAEDAAEKPDDSPSLMERLVYGTARLAGGVSARSSRSLVTQVLDAGVRAIDCAPPYGMGSAESVVGAAIGRHPAGSTVTVIAKVGLPRPTMPLLRSVARAGKRLIRPTPPRSFTDWSPQFEMSRSGHANFAPEAMEHSLNTSLQRLKRCDILLLHECHPDDFTQPVRDGIERLAKAHDAQPGFGWGAVCCDGADRAFPDSYISECAIDPDILAGRRQAPIRPTIFHSIPATAAWLERTDPEFADLLQRVAGLIPAETSAAWIAAAYAIAAVRAPQARYVFASTDWDRLGALLSAFQAIDRDGILDQGAAKIETRQGITA